MSAIAQPTLRELVVGYYAAHPDIEKAFEFAVTALAARATTALSYRDRKNGEI